MSRYLLLNFEDFGLNQDITKTIQPYKHFCLCCLDRNGPMVNLNQCKHRSYLEPFDKPEFKQFNQLICLQCHSILKKIRCFQEQILESQHILLSGTFTNTSVNNKKINRLIVQNVVDDLQLPPEETLDNYKPIDSTDDIFIHPSQNEEYHANITDKISIISNTAHIIDQNTLSLDEDLQSGMQDHSNLKEDFSHEVKVNSNLEENYSHEMTSNSNLDQNYSHEVIENSNLEQNYSHDITDNSNLEQNFSHTITDNSNLEQNFSHEMAESSNLEQNFSHTITDNSNLEQNYSHEMAESSNLEQNFSHTITDNSNIEQNFSHEMAESSNLEQNFGHEITANSNLNQNFGHEMENNRNIDQNFIHHIETNSNIGETFTTISDTQEFSEHRFSIGNKNIKTALEILERNNQSFVTLGSQLQFLNGEHLSFLETSLLSKEILTDIPLVPAKRSSDLENSLLHTKSLDIEIDVPDKMFYDSLDLSPELMGKESLSEMIKIGLDETADYNDIEIAETKTKTKERKVKRNRKPILIKTVRLSQDQLNRERVLLAQSNLYLRHKYRCGTCLIGFNYEENLEDHNKRRHGPLQKENVICDICSQVVPSIGNMTEHKYRHFTRYECLHCSKRYHTQDEAIRHCSRNVCGANRTALKTKSTQMKKSKLKQNKLN